MIKKQAEEIQMLVSIIVITYNSSRYVLETLESAYRQTYADIELIVSDDCSTDNTFTLCQEWVEAHKDRFVRTLCTQTPHNGGICWNYNHALQHAQGEWIKYIAGDDILIDNCIERFVTNLIDGVFLYSCTTKQFNSNKDTNTVTNCTQPHIKLKNKTASQQVRSILKHQYAVPGSTLFFHRSHLIALEGFNMRYAMLEDWPIVLTHLLHNHRCCIIDENLVLWRFHSGNVSNSSVYTTIFKKNVKDAVRFYTLHYCWRYGLFLHQYHYLVSYWIEDHYKNNELLTAIGYLLRCTDTIHIKNKIANKFKSSW